jgi:hypothetical protein
MNKHLLALAAAAALLSTLPAHAANFVGVTTGGPVIVEDYSADGLISFDIDFLAVTSATLSYRIGAADLGGMGVSFNAVLRNFTDSGLNGYTFSLSTGLFDEIGTVTRQFGGASTISFNGADASVAFMPPEFLDVEIGDPLAVGGNKIDWRISGLALGDRVNLTVSAVPEPGTWALMLGGMGMVGWLASRRRRQD